MDSFDELTPGITVINIVALIATFLLKTNRALSCIKLSKECLVLLHRGILGKRNLHVKTSYRMIYELMFSSYRQIGDNLDQDIIECGHKVLAFLCESGEKAYEGELTFYLAQLNKKQSRYEEATELYEKAASVMIIMDIGETTRLKNFTRKHLQSEKKLETKKEKQLITETLEWCFCILKNLASPKNTSKKHYC